MTPSLLKLLCRMGVPTPPEPTPFPTPCVWPNIDKGESVVVNGLWRSMEPVGLRRRVGLLLEGGELMPSCGGRLMRELDSSAPVKEPDVEDEEFKRNEKRSKRDTSGSVPAPTSSSFVPTLMRSFESPVSGSEAVWKRGRRACPVSNVCSMDVDLWPPKMTLLSRREPGLEDRSDPLPLSAGDCKSSKEDALITILLVADDLSGGFRAFAPGFWSCWD